MKRGEKTSANMIKRTKKVVAVTAAVIVAAVSIWFGIGMYNRATAVAAVDVVYDNLRTPLDVRDNVSYEKMKDAIDKEPMAFPLSQETLSKVEEIDAVIDKAKWLRSHSASFFFEVEYRDGELYVFDDSWDDHPDGIRADDYVNSDLWGYFDEYGWHYVNRIPQSSDQYQDYDAYREEMNQLEDINDSQKVGGDPNEPSVVASAGTSVDSNANSGNGYGSIDEPTPVTYPAATADGITSSKPNGYCEPPDD